MRKKKEKEKKKKKGYKKFEAFYGRTRSVR